MLHTTGFLAPTAAPTMHPTLPTETIDVRDKAVVAERIKGSVSSKQYGYEDLLAPLIAGAAGGERAGGCVSWMCRPRSCERRIVLVGMTHCAGWWPAAVQAGPATQVPALPAVPCVPQKHASTWCPRTPTTSTWTMCAWSRSTVSRARHHVQPLEWTGR